MTAIDELTGKELDWAVSEAIGEVPCNAWRQFTAYPLQYCKSTGACQHERCYPVQRGPSEYHNRAFSEVKREIERRGWNWHSVYIASKCKFRFAIDVLPGVPNTCNTIKRWAETEEVAGCRAFLKAVEAETAREAENDSN